MIVALWIARKAERDGKLARRNAQLAVARRMLAKLLEVVNSVQQLHQHMETQTNKTEVIGPEGRELWQMVHPLVGFSSEHLISFGGEDAELLLEVEEAEFLMDLMLLGRRHASLIASMQEYGVRRDALFQLAPASESFSGLIGTIRMNQQDYMRIKPCALALDNFINQLRENCAKDAEMALDVAARFGPIIRQRLGTQSFRSWFIRRRHKLIAFATPTRTATMGFLFGFPIFCIVA